MNATVIPFPSKRAEVFVDPVEDDGGSWGVFYQWPGRIAAQIGTHFAFDNAEAAARKAAETLGAVYLGDPAPYPQGAA